MTAIKKYMEKRVIIEQLKSINNAGTQAAKIIENMLSFSKKSDLKRSKNRLNELIDKTIDLAKNDYDLKRNYDFRKIEIIREYDFDVPAVLCEASKIQQVLFNVIKNASEAMNQGSKPNVMPKLIFRLKVQSKLACIEIEDNGPGMDDQTKKRIFEPFFTTKSVDKGTGLGLSVSYFIIVNDHKGKMEVDSTPEIGAKFIIKLPIEQKKLEVVKK